MSNTGISSQHQEVQSRQLAKVRHSSPSQRSLYLQLRLDSDCLPLGGVDVICEAKDQGWGNTRHSYMQLILVNEEAEVKHQMRVGAAVGPR